MGGRGNECDFDVIDERVHPREFDVRQGGVVCVVLQHSFLFCVGILLLLLNEKMFFFLFKIFTFLKKLKFPYRFSFD